MYMSNFNPSPLLGGGISVKQLIGCDLSVYLNCHEIKTGTRTNQNIGFNPGPCTF